MTGDKPWPSQASQLPDSSPDNSQPITSVLHQRELNPTFRSAAIRRAAAVYDSRLPTLLCEREVPFAKVSQYDKAFTAAWVGQEEVALGTKCNKLLILNTTTHAIRSIPLPNNPYRRDTDAHCGMHALAVNHSCDLIATGGDNPKDVTIFAMPSYRPVQTLMAHTDWIFGLAWITDCHIATGSRDKTINLWKIEEDSLAINPYPIRSSDVHRGKVRDLRFSLAAERLASLSSDGTLKIWDPKLDLLQSYVMPCSEELVALAMRDNLLAAGSKDYVSLLDVRSNELVGNVDLTGMDPYGVRSLAFNRDIVSCGGASGHMLFYDMRAAAFLHCGPAPAGSSAATCCSHTGTAPNGSRCGGHGDNKARKWFLETGNGWFNEEDRLYRTLLQGQRVRMACYSHCWDSYGGKFFGCGGPLAVGLRGSYMAMWE